MELILKQDVEGVGKAGSIINVKDGFARNFLIPKKMAVLLNAANMKDFEQEKAKKTFKLEREKKEAEALRDNLSSVSLTIPVLTQENDKLYGSITSLDIQRVLKDEGYDIDKDSIILEEPLKTLGIYQVPVKLHADVSTQIKVWIVKK